MPKRCVVWYLSASGLAASSQGLAEVVEAGRPLGSSRSYSARASGRHPDEESNVRGPVERLRTMMWASECQDAAQ